MCYRALQSNYLTEAYRSAVVRGRYPQDFYIIRATA